MRPFRPMAGVATALVLLSLLPAAACAPPDPGMEERRLVGSTSRVEKTYGKPEGKTLSASFPVRDARGEPVPGIPRPPGSVRVGYSEGEADGLKLVRAEYLAEERPDAVRGFYRGVFGAGGWQVANVEYPGDGWHFLILRGGREAEVEVVPRGGGSEVRVELSRPEVAQEAPPPAGGSKR